MTYWASFKHFALVNPLLSTYSVTFYYTAHFVGDTGHRELLCLAQGHKQGRDQTAQPVIPSQLACSLESARFDIKFTYLCFYLLGACMCAPLHKWQS